MKLQNITNLPMFNTICMRKKLVNSTYTFNSWIIFQWEGAEEFINIRLQVGEFELQITMLYIQSDFLFI